MCVPSQFFAASDATAGPRQIQRLLSTLYRWVCRLLLLCCGTQMDHFLSSLVAKVGPLPPSPMNSIRSLVFDSQFHSVIVHSAPDYMCRFCHLLAPLLSLLMCTQTISGTKVLVLILAPDQILWDSPMVVNLSLFLPHRRSAKLKMLQKNFNHPNQYWLCKVVWPLQSYAA